MGRPASSNIFNPHTQAGRALDRHYGLMDRVEQKIPQAELRLAEQMARGAPYVKRNEREALRTCLRLARSGEFEPLYTLGRFLMEGTGTKPDAAAAKKIFTRAQAVAQHSEERRFVEAKLAKIGAPQPR
jgi:TPR repeat protein